VCSSTDVASFELPHSIEAPSAARDAVERHLCPEHGREALAAAQVLVTELATCAVLYGVPPVTLELECGVTWLRISVTHHADGTAAGDIPIDEAGGLRSALLAKLSRSWGVDRTPGGRRLWSSIPTGFLPTRSETGMASRSGPAV
jgi:hypothetical protein